MKSPELFISPVDHYCVVMPLPTHLPSERASIPIKVAFVIFAVSNTHESGFVRG